MADTREHMKAEERTESRSSQRSAKGRVRRGGVGGVRAPAAVPAARSQSRTSVDRRRGTRSGRTMNHNCNEEFS